MKISVLNESEYKSWYKNNLCEDFPINEVKPLDNILSLKKNGKYEVLMYKDIATDSLLGYATIWKCLDSYVYLLDYLGTPSHLRNQGIGSRILKRLEYDLKNIEGMEHLHIVLESETPIDNDSSEENIIRQRRIRFYQRNGWVKMYEMATCGMRFDAMTFQNFPSELSTIQSYHRKIYGPTRTDVLIPLQKGQTPPLPYWMK